MNRFLIAATLSALMAACAVEQMDPPAPAVQSDGDPLSAATSMDEQASTASITPRLCATPWISPGPYYFCTATDGPWWRDRNACTASCGGLCELIAWCSAPCSCTPN